MAARMHNQTEALRGDLAGLNLDQIHDMVLAFAAADSASILNSVFGSRFR